MEEKNTNAELGRKAMLQAALLEDNKGVFTGKFSPRKRKEAALGEHCLTNQLALPSPFYVQVISVRSAGTLQSKVRTEITVYYSNFRI